MDRAGRKQTLPPMSVLNSGWSHRGESLPAQEPGSPANLDGDPGCLQEGDPEEASAQHPAVLRWGLPDLDTNPATHWPGLPTLLQQLPPQDSDTSVLPAGLSLAQRNLFLQERFCLALAEEELAELRLFCAQRRREALGQGVAHLVPSKLKECTCEKCREPLKPGEYGVFAALAGERHCWHQACFACQTCGQALINFIYFYHDGHLYCGRHHAELLRPRCPACDQLIFSPRCTEAEGQRWHENHFCCQDCAGPLGGGRYALQGGGPCCPSCFRSRYSAVRSSPASTVEGRPTLGTGEAGLDGIEGGDNDPLHFATISEAALNAVASSSQKTQRGLLGTSPDQESRAGDKAEAPKAGGQGPLETPADPKEDAPCLTCSSSSDSEPEGFFFGQRLPLPSKTPRSLQAEGSDISRKHCTIC